MLVIVQDWIVFVSNAPGQGEGRIASLVKMEDTRVARYIAQVPEQREVRPGNVETNAEYSG
jgi:hypothetical protein